MSLKQQAARGILWTGSAKFAVQALQFVITAILARLLSKEDFGLVGMAAILTAAIVLVNERGLGSAIIQRKTIEERHLSSSFWASIVFGGILVIFSLALSGLFAAFFRNPKVQPIIIWMAVSFIIGAFGIVQKSILTRYLDFRKLAISETVAVVISGIASVIMAFAGLGVWSIVWGTVIKDAIIVLYLWIFVSWKPKFYFDWRSFQELFGFGANVLANNAAIYAMTNIDYIIIGRTLGAAALGVYSLALNTIKLPIYRFSALVSKVAFPAFAVVQDDLLKFRSGYIKSLRYISVITFPLITGLALLAPELILVVYGEKWLPMVLPLQILCPMGLLKSIGTTKGAVLLARGRADIEFRWNLFFLLPLALGLAWASRFGLVGVTVTYTIIYIIGFPVIQGITNRQIGLSWSCYFRSFRAAFYSTLFMSATIGMFRFVNQGQLHLNYLFFLIIAIIGGAVIYTLSLLVIDRSIMAEMIGLVLTNGKIGTHRVVREKTNRVVAR